MTSSARSATMSLFLSSACQLLDNIRCVASINCLTMACIFQCYKLHDEYPRFLAGYDCATSYNVIRMRRCVNDHFTTIAADSYGRRSVTANS